MQGQYNRRSPAVKRLMREAQELSHPTEQYYAQPLEDNLFEWHFTIRGPADSEFDGGIYHGRIILPPDYPMKPPSIILLTPNGRFEVYKKICLSISGHHPESWQPSWSIRTALLAIIGFMPTHGNGAIGSLDYTADERKVLAKKTAEWKCTECGSIKNILQPVTEASDATKKEAQEIAAQMNFQGEKEKSSESASPPSPTATSAPSSTTATPPNTPVSATPPQVPPFPTPPPFMLPPNLQRHPMFYAANQGQGRLPFPPPFPPTTTAGFPPFPMFPGVPPVPGQQQQQQQPGSMPWFPQFQAQMMAQMAGFPHQTVPPAPAAAAAAQNNTPGAGTGAEASVPSSSSAPVVGACSTAAVGGASTAASDTTVAKSTAPAASTVESSTAASNTAATSSTAASSTEPTPASTTTPAPATTTTTTPQTTPTTTQQSSVRRRAVVTTPRAPQSAELPPRVNRPAPRESMGAATLSLVIIISIALLLLVLRRLHMMNILDLRFMF